MDTGQGTLRMVLFLVMVEFVCCFPVKNKFFFFFYLGGGGGGGGGN